jgi:acyl-[acyl-carrier-protein] desaturase
MMLAFEDMMRKKIVMPAHFMRESGEAIGEVFTHFSNAAQRLGVYTATDYYKIIESLLRHWEIDKVTGLNDQAERARDYLMKLPQRLARISERLKTPELEYKFRWIAV